MTDSQNPNSSATALISYLLDAGILKFDPGQGFTMPTREGLIDALSGIKRPQLTEFAAEACIATVELYAALAKDENRDTQLVTGAIGHWSRSRARKGAAAKNANDPKQAAKAAARELWQQWKLGSLPKIRTTEQYAVEVMRRWPVLKSAKNICEWSAAWNKEAADKRKANPVC
jgi:hypothetical protein